MGLVLCVGPVYLDLNFLAFPCDEGLPVEREVIGGEYSVVPGGSAANFARVGRSLGLDVKLAGKVGPDPVGDLLTGLLSAAGVELALGAEAKSSTNVGINFTSPTGKSVMATGGSASRALRAPEIQQLVESAAPDASHLYLGGLLKMGGLLEGFGDLVDVARSRGISVVVDHGRVPRDASPQMLAHVRQLVARSDIYLPSRDEFLTVWGTETVEAAARAALSEARRPEQVIAVKSGPDGAVAFTGETSVSTPAYQVAVRSMVGAGDSFNAGFVTARMRDLPLAECVDFACATAAVMISRSDLPDLGAIERLRSGDVTGRPIGAGSGSSGG